MSELRSADLDAGGEATEPRVRLVNCFARPYDNAVAAARSCYAARGIVTPEQAAGDGLDAEQARKRRARRDAIARDIYRAGHHTTFQHAHLQYTLENVSRQFVWSFLHAHPFYNSEQVSQRYVEVDDESFYRPALPGALRDRYLEAARAQIEAYRRLAELLEPVAAAEFFRIFPGRKNGARWQTAIRRRALEVARYVLPVATLTRLYHTISAITLLRYHRLAGELDAPSEQRLVVGRMVEELLRLDPDYARIIEEPLPLEDTIEYRWLATARAAGAITAAADATARAAGAITAAADATARAAGAVAAPLADGSRAAAPFDRASPAGERDARASAAEFDAALGGWTSRLVARKTDNEELLAASVREVLGVPRPRLGDDEAIDLVLDPARNPYLAESLDLTSMSKLMRCLAHPGYTFRKRLSHTADSQDQRHRTTPASRPCLAAYLSRDPDVVTPRLIAVDERARRFYDEATAQCWERIDAARRHGLRDEIAAYLLPNGVALRFTESADLAGLHHKLEMRLCYNAQEEIWRASLDEARQIAAVEPRIGRHLAPPCTQRLGAGVTPVCPEGRRYCGVRVWDLDLDSYERLL